MGKKRAGKRGVSKLISLAIIFLLSLPLIFAITTYIELPDEDHESIPLTITSDSLYSNVVALGVDANVPNEEAACTVWEIETLDSISSICYGNDACCSFAGYTTEESSWDETLYLNKGKYGAGDKNIVTAQVISIEYTLDLEDPSVDPRVDIRYSDKESVEAYFVEEGLPTGDVVLISDDESDLSNVYIQIGDAPTEYENIDIVFSENTQGKVTLSQPVQWYQEVSVHNAAGEEQNLQLNLWNHEDQSFLKDVDTFKIFSEGKLISDTHIAIVPLGVDETKIFQVIYETPAVTVDKECKGEFLKDLIPRDAEIVNSDLPLQTPIKKVCTIKVAHDGDLHYRDIDIRIDDLDINDIDSVYYVEGKRHLDVEEGVIVLPEIN